MTIKPAKRPRPPPRKKTSTVPSKSIARAKANPAAQPEAPADLFERIATILERARARVARAVNTEMVLTYWQIGREIVEHLQEGDVRAGRGQALIDDLSELLGARFGRGFSTTNLRYFRTFFLAFRDRDPELRHVDGPSLAIASARDRSAVRAKRHIKGGVLEDPLAGFSPVLGWSHYRALMKVEHEAARRFYEIEAEQEGWSAAQLEQQIHTQLFARLLKSRDKAGLIDLASRGQALDRPIDVIKDPYVLDFLDLPEAHQLREHGLESAILEKLQRFLLELGKGFAFVARQMRITFDEDCFYIDLVFYNIILKCYMLIDLKLGKLTHQDVGQMDGYVRLFDEQHRNEGDGPTIGLILCARKNEAIARYSVLHDNEQLFAAKYVTYLPSEKELELELARERKLLEERAVGGRVRGKAGRS